MNIIQQFLETKLKQSASHILLPDEEVQSHNNINAFILSKLLSKKFRKWKLDPSCIARTENAINLQIEKGEPIKITYFQGGYKLWRFPSSPTVDWAEFFNIAYVLQYIAPIASAYKPGVDLTYYCHTLLMELHDNLTTDEIKQYMDSLQCLFDEFSQYLPKNIRLNILKDADFYTRDEYFKALEIGKDKAIEDVKAWPESKLKEFERMAQLNIKWQGREDWTSMTPVQKSEKIHLAALYEQAATSNLPKVMESVKSAEKILLFTKPSPMFIGIGSTRTSIAKHWVGYGVLEQDDQGFYERVLTPSQYELVKNYPHHEETVQVSQLKNLQTVNVYRQRFDFTIKQPQQ